MVNWRLDFQRKDPTVRPGHTLGPLQHTSYKWSLQVLTMSNKGSKARILMWVMKYYSAQPSRLIRRWLFRDRSQCSYDARSCCHLNWVSSRLEDGEIALSRVCMIWCWRLEMGFSRLVDDDDALSAMRETMTSEQLAAQLNSLAEN